MPTPFDRSRGRNEIRLRIGGVRSERQREFVSEIAELARPRERLPTVLDWLYLPQRMPSRTPPDCLAVLPAVSPLGLTLRPAQALSEALTRPMPNIDTPLTFNRLLDKTTSQNSSGSQSVGSQTDENFHDYALFPQTAVANYLTT